ncbi:Cu-Zn family superoxide dismutase [Thermocatellispora tengchongensis]|uniref:Cu-Zn family superoxide dismutase n=1 Tax=Thermocatellispora tengchongensis TaxID=1073253 RepID=A0A840P5G6_9ACTN|nr:superoxide dismutase family protein [Thermocatellispora tengchongensis]MBB5136554.1 Cu-Zn family superoxide dismutase [Thermocatellispora tengchongensis]
MRRRPSAVHLVALIPLALLAAGCGGQGPEAADGRAASPAAAPAAAPGSPTSPTSPGSPTSPVSPGTPEPGGLRLSGGGPLTPYKEGNKAVAYDAKLVPQGARAEITVTTTGGETVSELTVSGLVPNRRYGSHLHAKACGPKPDASGPHYQHTHTPGPSHLAANPVNEVWLDFTTDASGAATSTARQPWPLKRGHLPKSLVIHADPTVTSGPSAGSAGDRVACVTLTPASS